MKIQFKACTLEHLPALQAIGRETFSETFASQNDPANLEHYLQQAFSIEELTKQVQTKGSFFFSRNLIL